MEELIIFLSLFVFHSFAYYQYRRSGDILTEGKCDGYIYFLPVTLGVA